MSQNFGYTMKLRASIIASALLLFAGCSADRHSTRNSTTSAITGDSIAVTALHLNAASTVWHLAERSDSCILEVRLDSLRTPAGAVLYGLQAHRGDYAPTINTAAESNRKTADSTVSRRDSRRAEHSADARTETMHADVMAPLWLRVTAVIAAAVVVGILWRRRRNNR